jgi:hypothetical protein
MIEREPRHEENDGRVRRFPESVERENAMNDFDRVAANISEIVEAIFSEERDRDRRFQLIRFQIRRALGIGYRAARGSNKRAEADGPTLVDAHRRRA